MPLPNMGQLTGCLVVTADHSAARPAGADVGLLFMSMAFLSSAATLRSFRATSASHLASAPPAGADVGGFFGNVDTELLVRWNQVATFYPFFRGHAHLEAKRREPWLFGEDATRQNRAAIRARYALLPYLYTLFWEAHTSGGSLEGAWMSRRGSFA